MALPAAPSLASAVPYPVFATRKYYFVPTMAAYATPTLAELNAGTDLTINVSAVSGFSQSAAAIDVPRAGTYFTGTIPGRTTAADSTLDIYVSQTGTDVRTTLTQGLTGYVVIFTEGIVTGGKCSVFPVRIGSVQLMEDLEAVAMCQVQFYIYNTPAENVAIPTA